MFIHTFWIFPEKDVMTYQEAVAKRDGGKPWTLEGANVNFRCSFTHSEFFWKKTSWHIRKQWPKEMVENHEHFLITGVDLECSEKETDIFQVWDISPPSYKPLLQLHLLTTPSLCCIRYVQSMDKQCAISQAKMCAAEWSIWAYCVKHSWQKKYKPYIPQPSGQPPCPAAHGLSHYHRGCSEAPPQLPSLHSEDREMPHHKQNLSNKQQ